jgi:hypothetical protein
LALDIGIVFEELSGAGAALVAGATFFAVAIFALYALEFALKRRRTPMRSEPKEPISLADKVGLSRRHA